MKYRVGVIERHERTYVVEADSEDAALEQAANLSEYDEWESFTFHSDADRDTWNITPVTE